MFKKLALLYSLVHLLFLPVLLGSLSFPLFLLGNQRLGHFLSFVTHSVYTFLADRLQRIRVRTTTNSTIRKGTMTSEHKS